MLNKKICKMCINNYRNIRWNWNDENLWSKRNKIQCPVCLMETQKRIGNFYPVCPNDNNSPPWCVYQVEHIIMKE